MDLVWVGSSETVWFDTPDGELAEGQYAVFKNGFLVRRVPPNADGVSFVRRLDPAIDTTEVAIVPGRKKWHHTFAIPGSLPLRGTGVPYRKWRIGTTEAGFGLTRLQPPSRTATEEEIVNLTAGDARWR